MKYLVIFIIAATGVKVYSQDLKIDDLNKYFLEADLTERDYLYEDNYRNKIPDRLCEKYFRITFNSCESRCYSIGLQHNKAFNSYIVGRPCCAGGDCSKESLFNLDERGNFIDEIIISEQYADLSFYHEMKSTIIDNIVVSIVTVEEYDYKRDTITGKKISYSYHEIDTSGIIHPLSKFEESPNRKYSFTSKRFVGDEDLKSMNLADLAIMRNEIYADYGYKFSSMKWKSYFNKFDWYKPENEEMAVELKLNKIEKINIRLILEEELSRK